MITFSAIQNFREELLQHKLHLKFVRENPTAMVGTMDDLAMNEQRLQELETALNSFENHCLGDWWWGSEVDDEGQPIPTMLQILESEAADAGCYDS